MQKINLKVLTLFFVSSYIILVVVFYNGQKQYILEEANKRIGTILTTNKALHKFVENVQKPVIYNLKKEGKLYKEFFDPKLLSFTYIARNIHQNYVDIEELNKNVPYSYKLAATNPRNLVNKATEFEANILNKFRKGTIDKFSTIIEENNQKYFYKATPIAKNKESCMRCHSTPDKAPSELIDIYGDKAGFGEKVGDIRAMISLKIPVSEIMKDGQKQFFTNIGIVLFIFVILYIFIAMLLKKDEKLQKALEDTSLKSKEIQTVLDATTTIVILSNGKEISNVNNSFFKFFDNINGLEEFKESYSCICDRFEIVDDAQYISSKTINNIAWTEYVLNHPHEIFKAAIKKNDDLYHFIIRMQKTDINGEDFIVIELNDITDELEIRDALREKEKQLFESQKMASMGEMIGNIAHQWRQPLSAISTAASGVSIESDMNSLDNNKLRDYMDGIVRNTQYLSTTIDTFRDFIREDKEKKEVLIQECIKKAIDIEASPLKNNHIKLKNKVDLSKKTTINLIPGELPQVIINIFNNAKDVLSLNNIEEPWIKIDLEEKNSKAIITIEDNGGGIPEEMLPKIFDPYFTTKHQSQGTGLGLHMSYKIITESLSGKLYVKNTENGAKFFIELPLG